MKRNNRQLKVEEVGDFYNHNTWSFIRLRGKWLKNAGFVPNTHVQVENPAPGILVLHAVEKSTTQGGF